MDPLKIDYSLPNTRIRDACRRVGVSVKRNGEGYGVISFSLVTTRLLYYLTNHHDRVMKRTPAGELGVFQRDA